MLARSVRCVGHLDSGHPDAVVVTVPRLGLDVEAAHLVLLVDGNEAGGEDVEWVVLSVVYFMLVSDPTRRIFLAELQQSQDP